LKNIDLYEMIIESHMLEATASTATLRRATNSFKHGLYAKKLAYSTPGDHSLYQDILHDYVQHYRPITPDEETLVQQLTALQFRHIKVQTFQADAMRAEVLVQCQNAAPEADGSIPTETAIETRAFEALCQKPAFRLYLQELNRLPNKIQRTIERIHLLIRLRPEIAAWPVNQPAIVEASEPQPAEAPAALSITTKSEQTAQQEGTKSGATKSNEPGITTIEGLIHLWNHYLDDETRIVLLHGPFDWAPRQNFFTQTKITEKQFWIWIKQARQEGRIQLPPEPEWQVGVPDAA
jgi:hypothetical protein